MESGLLQHPEVGTSAVKTGRDKSLRGTPSVTLMLREAGVMPIVAAGADTEYDPSPLRHLSGPQRERRLVGMLELLAMNGDGAAAAKALDHYRWATEMRRGKAPQRIDLNASGSITVVNDLSGSGQTPVPKSKRLQSA